jgi:hypothetical protein
MPIDRLAIYKYFCISAEIRLGKIVDQFFLKYVNITISWIEDF